MDIILSLLLFSRQSYMEVNGTILSIQNHHLPEMFFPALYGLGSFLFPVDSVQRELVMVHRIANNVKHVLLVGDWTASVQVV